MSVVLSDDRQQVLLLRREVFILWDLPGGGIEKGEAPADAAVREAREESGYHIAIERPVGRYLHQSIYGRGDQLTHTFRETTGLRWFPINALPRGVEPLQRQMIADALTDLPEPVERRIDFARWKLYLARVIFFMMRMRNIAAWHLLKWWRGRK